MASGSWVQETSYTIVSFILRQLTGEWSNLAWQWFSKFFGAPVAVLDDPLVQRLVQVAVGIALGCLPVAIGWMTLQETIARMDGSSSTPPEALIRRGMMAGLAVTGTSLVAWFMMSLADYGRQVMAAVGLDINLVKQFFDMPHEPGNTVVALTGLFLIGALILTIQRAILAAEITVLLVIGPLMGAGLIRENGQTSWHIWLREMVSLLITPLIQMLVLLLFIRKWGGSTALTEIGARFASLAFLYVLWNTPRWARQMVYSAGAGGAVAGVAVNAGRLVMVRQMLRVVTKV